MLVLKNLVILLLFLILGNTIHLKGSQQYDVVIIGAGISGLGASQTLSKANLNHIIIQARDHIGGRILPSTLDGITVHVGASFVHEASQKNNRIVKFMSDYNIQNISAHFQGQRFFYDGSGEITDEVTTQAQNLFDQLSDSIEKKATNTAIDVSIKQAATPFIESMEAQGQVKDIVNWQLNLLGNIEGAQIEQISAKSYLNGGKQNDVLPVGGWINILKQIQKLCKSQIIFNQKVISIDYSGELVKIVTPIKTYFAKKVISSLPLGVLKRNQVNFIPGLPDKHSSAINKMGNGVANKIIVSFETAFWDKDTYWLNFVTKGKSRYPVAFSMSEGDKNILCFFISGDDGKQLGEKQNKQIIDDLIKFLNRFKFQQEIKIRDYIITRWHKENYSYGSYSFSKVGTTSKDIQNLKQPIDNKIWFIGEHCHPRKYSYAHTAYQTGIWAAQEIIQSLKEE